MLSMAEGNSGKTKREMYRLKEMTHEGRHADVDNDNTETFCSTSELWEITK